MRRILTMFFILTAMLGIACSEQPSSPTAQEQPDAARQEGYAQPPAPQQEAVLQTAEGALSKLDAQMELLWIKTKDGKEMQFSYNKDTRVEGAAQTVEGLAGMSGSNLRVHYRTEGSSNIAMQIEVLPRAG